MILLKLIEAEAEDVRRYTVGHNEDERLVVAFAFRGRFLNFPLRAIDDHRKRGVEARAAPRDEIGGHEGRDFR